MPQNSKVNWEYPENLVYAQGNKMNNVDVVYTLWSNLRKTPGMDVGQVGFHSEKEVSIIFFHLNIAWLLF